MSNVFWYQEKFDIKMHIFYIKITFWLCIFLFWTEGSVSHLFNIHIFRNRSFGYSAPAAWNYLPKDLHYCSISLLIVSSVCWKHICFVPVVLQLLRGVRYWVCIFILWHNTSSSLSLLLLLMQNLFLGMKEPVIKTKWVRVWDDCDCKQSKHWILPVPTTHKDKNHYC